MTQIDPSAVKPLLISTNDIDGGAARAAYRIHRSLQAIAVPSQMLVQNKSSADPTVIAQKAALAKLSARFNGKPAEFYRQRDRTLFSPQWLPDPVAPKVAQLAPNVINLHWICNGYLRIETLRQFRQPLVWTLHDMWPLTGGCHYSQACDRYTQTCGTCPHLKSQQPWDLSRWIWQRKARIYPHLNLTLVSPSHWLAEQARASSLGQNLRIEVIPHGLDTQVFKPIDSAIARHLLNLPCDRPLLLFGATSGATGDPRKGLPLLQTALQHLAHTDPDCNLELVIFGADAPNNPPNFGFKTYYLGQLHDDITLTMAYSAADVMLVPSRQEAFGQTASEALACGTPVVAFAATGLKDIVEHQKQGYLATPFDPIDLAKGITWVLSDRDRHPHLRYQARQKIVTELNQDLQAQRYLSLFSELVAVAQSPPA